MGSMKPYRLLFVCTGNICRSPTAEAVMRRTLCLAGLQDRVMPDSAGTHAYHIGEPPDPRAIAAAQRRGYDLTPFRARQVCAEDYDTFDLILGMDFSNLERLQADCPAEHQHKLGLLMPYATRRRALIVHDPYYRSAREFDLVLDYIEDACEGLTQNLASRVGKAATRSAFAVPARDLPLPVPDLAARVASGNAAG